VIATREEQTPQGLPPFTRRRSEMAAIIKAANIKPD
jgi:hypothetical protein